MNRTSPIARSRRIRFGWLSESIAIFSRDILVWVASVAICALSEFLVLFGLSGTRSFTAVHNFSGSSFHSNVQVMGPGASIAYVIITVAVRSFYGAGLFRMGARAVLGERLTVADLFLGAPSIVNYFLYSLIFSVLCSMALVVCGPLVFFVAAIFWPGFSLVSMGASSLEAFGNTYGAMKSHTFLAGAFAFVFCLILVVSLLPAFLGLLVTVPMAVIISSLAVRDIVSAEVEGEVSTDQNWPPAPGVWPPPPTTEERAAKSDTQRQSKLDGTE